MWANGCCDTGAYVPAPSCCPVGAERPISHRATPVGEGLSIWTMTCDPEPGALTLHTLLLGEKISRSAAAPWSSRYETKRVRSAGAAASNVAAQRLIEFTLTVV